MVITVLTRRRIYLTLLTKPILISCYSACPRQRRSSFESYRHRLEARYILVGGYFDIMSGLIRRAPRWMQDTGLEWLFRLMQEPRRLWKRYLIGIFQFFWLVTKEKFRRAFNRKKE